MNSGLHAFGTLKNLEEEAVLELININVSYSVCIINRTADLEVGLFRK